MSFSDRHIFNFCSFIMLTFLPGTEQFKSFFFFSAQHFEKVSSYFTSVSLSTIMLLLSMSVDSEIYCSDKVYHKTVVWHSFMYNFSEEYMVMKHF